MVQTAKQRGWIPVALRYTTYLRLDALLLTRKEKWDSVVVRVLDDREDLKNKVEKYEKLYGNLPE